MVAQGIYTALVDRGKPRQKCQWREHHVWTAPALQGQSCGLGSARVGCVHVCGLFVRPCLMTAGPDGVRGSTPHQRVALRSRLKLCGLCRSPVRPGRAITSLSPSQTCEARLTASGYPAAAAGERKLSPRIIKAQAIRAILFASAMMTTLGGRRACRARIHASPVAALALAKRIALPAPM